MRFFKGYKGQGKLIIANHGAVSAKVGINGRSLDISQALKKDQGVTKIDIGSYVRDGRNTFHILDIQPQGAWIEADVAYPVLSEGSPESAGFSRQKLQRVDELIQGEVEKGFPGAVLLVLKDGKIVKQTAYGWAKKYDGSRLLPRNQWQPMTVDTMFDLASNTKMYATILAFMKLTEEGRVSPEDFVKTYLPGFTGEGRDAIRIRDVMVHRAGFAPEIHYFANPAGKTYSRQRERTMTLLEKAPLAYPTGTKTVYSDTDYMLLGTIIERITGQPLDQYVENEIYRPLGLTHTLFNPLQKGYQSREFAATEPCGNTRSGMVDFPGIRAYTLQGEVHDEKAWYSMGGVAGHAGLFSRVRDLAVLTQLMLNKGGYGEYRLCSPGTVTYFTKPGDADPAFGLGWNKGGLAKRVWEFGPYAGDEAIGHTGWTGTDICIDPANDLAIILLTNRIHEPNVPGQPNDFVTDDFQTPNYGSIMSLVYEAFLEHN